MTSALKDKDFRILKTSKKNVTMALKAIPQQEFQKCLQQWQYRWAKYTAAEREHFKHEPSQQAVSKQVHFQ